MAFLLISDSIENTIDMLRSEAELNETVFKQTLDTKYQNKAKEYRDKLQTAIRYKKIFDRKTEYQKIKHLRFKNLNAYKDRCSDITKKMPGVYFDKDRFLFRVQITRKGVRKYLGEFDTPDDALEILQGYINS